MNRVATTISSISTSVLNIITAKSISITLGLLLSAVAFTTSGCSSYSNKWDCGIVKGISCSSVEEADNVAREQIILNSDTKEKKSILVKEHYEGFKKKKPRTMEMR